MLSRLTGLILAMLILVPAASEAATGISVLESVTCKAEENRTAITLMYNQPTKMVFYTIGNPPQIVADIVGNAFAQAVNVPTEIMVDGAQVRSITPFIDPSLGDANFYGIDFMVIHLKEKVAYAQVKHKKGYTIYIANSPNQKVADIRPQFKKVVKKEEPQMAPEVIPAAMDKTAPAAAEVNIESQAIAAAINIEPDIESKAFEFKPDTKTKFVPKKMKVKSEESYNGPDDFIAVDTNLSFGKEDSDLEDENLYIKSKKPKAKAGKKTARKTTERVIKSDIPLSEKVKGGGIELEPKNTAAITPAPYTEKIKLAIQWRQVGYSHQKNMDYDKALSCYNRVVELRPDYACIHNDIGIIYFHLGIYDKAVEEFQRAIELDSEYLASYSNLAMFYEQIGNNQKAIEYWQKRAKASKSNDVWAQKAKQKIKELKRKSNK